MSSLRDGALSFYSRAVSCCFVMTWHCIPGHRQDSVPEDTGFYVILLDMDGMDCLYQTVTQISYEEYKKYAWVVGFDKKAWIRLAVFELIILVLAAFTRNPLLIVFAAAYTAVIVLIQNRRIKKVYQSNKLLHDRMITFAFYDTYLIEKTELGSTRIGYDKLHKIIDTKTNIYLMIAENQGYVLKKSAFPAGLAAFLNDIRKRLGAS